MARGKKSTEGSSYSYFKELFTKNRELLKAKKNAEILARYRADHGMAVDAPIEQKVVNNLSNLKSTMRKKLRKIKSNQAAAGGPPVVPPVNRLEVLEEMIDDCLTMARNEDREELEEVIHLLRRARNKVVWKHGEN